MVVVRVAGEVQPFVEAVVADGLEWVGAEVSKDAVDVVRRKRVSRAGATGQYRPSRGTRWEAYSGKVVSFFAAISEYTKLTRSADVALSWPPVIMLQTLVSRSGSCAGSGIVRFV